MAWEKTALDLAAAAGIDVPPAQLVKVGGRDVLVVERFDRHGTLRIGYCSAMTMLEASEGDVRSYLEIGEALEARSAAASDELRQLWRRMACSVLITNTDDHLRNHGFLHRKGDTWELSPAFDLNPNPDSGPKFLSTAIDARDTTASIDRVMGVAPYFRLTPDRARTALTEVVAAHAGWEATAAGNGLTRTAIADMAPAFEHQQARRARELCRA